MNTYDILLSDLLSRVEALERKQTPSPKPSELLDEISKIIATYESPDGTLHLDKDWDLHAPMARKIILRISSIIRDQALFGQDIIAEWLEAQVKNEPEE